MTQEDIDIVRQRVPEYAGLADPASRRRSDQRLRAWAGELLAALRERATLSEPLRARLDEAILRSEFGDQRLFRADSDRALDRPEAVTLLGAADRAAVEAVEAVLAAGVDPERLGPALDVLHAAYDTRIAAAVTFDPAD